MRNIVFTTVLALTLIGCSAMPDTPLAIADSSWSLPIQKESDCEVLPYLEFSEKKVKGDLGCNRFSAQYRLDGNQVTFENMALTKKRCDAKTMQVESKMLSALQATKYLGQTEEKLTFHAKDGTILMQLVPEILGACH